MQKTWEPVPLSLTADSSLRWQQEPCSASDVKCELQPFQRVPSTPGVCAGPQHKQRCLSEITGEEEYGVFSKLSNHLPAFQGPGNEQHQLPVHWKSWELSESKTHRSQQEMKILSTLNKQGHSLIKRNCRDTAYFWQWKVLFLTDLFFACFMGSTSILTAFLASTPWRQETQTCYCGDNHWLIYSTYLR